MDQIRFTIKRTVSRWGVVHIVQKYLRRIIYYGTFIFTFSLLSNPFGGLRNLERYGTPGTVPLRSTVQYDAKIAKIIIIFF